MNLIETNVDGMVGTIILNHGKKHNALSHELIGGLIDALTDFREQKIRAVVLRAQPGAKVWSAGHDVGELPEGRRDPLGWDDPLRNLVRTIESHPAPVIAMIEGTVWGGAVETMLACDIVISTPEATFAFTPARLGVPYNMSGMMTFMSAAGLRIVKELAFTAAPITAERAERIGMVYHVVPRESLAEFTYGMADTIVANAPLSIAVMKEQLRVLAGAKPVSPRGFEKVQGMRRIVYDSDVYAE
jgi:methylmalonyl-CoA decarboxylase